MKKLLTFILVFILAYSCTIINLTNYATADYQTPLYGELSVKDNLITTVIDTQDVYVQFTEFDTEGASSGMINRLAEDDTQIPFDVVCLVNVSLTAVATMGGSARTYTFQVQKNNGIEPLDNVIGSASIPAGSGTVVMQVSLSGINAFQAGDTVELWVKNISSATDVLIVHTTMTVIRLD